MAAIYATLKMANMIRKIVKRMKKAYLELLEDTLIDVCKELRRMADQYDDYKNIYNSYENGRLRRELQHLITKIEAISDLQLKQREKFSDAERH